MPAMAQERQPDYKAYRTNTWSIYVQGGASWADGVDMQNVNAAAGTLTNPLVGGGLNYNIRPWLRLRLNYEFSQYGREQRFAEYQPISTDFLKNQGMTLVESGGGKAYSKMWTQFHAADFSVEFNIAELWQNRKAQWLNAYLGTGFGYMMANGNSYESTSWLTAHNTRHAFNSPYVPATLSLEFDVTPRFTICGEASVEGATDYNRSLSDRRLQSVVRVFNEEGIGYDRILNSKSIGESNGIEGPEGRRVVIEMFRR